MTQKILDATRLPASATRWRCDPETLGLLTTTEVSAEHKILGQEDAADALQFGIESQAQGNNIFVRSLSGYGRIPLIYQLITEGKHNRKAAPDRCYVFNFVSPDQPRLISLPAGSGTEFRQEMERFADFVTQELPAYLSSDRVESMQKKLAAEIQAGIQKISEPFDSELRAANLMMVPIQVGQNMVPAILPVIDNKPVQFDEIRELRASEKMSEDEFKALMEKISQYEEKFGDVSKNIATLQGRYQDEMRKLMTREAHVYVGSRMSSIKSRFDIEAIGQFLDEVFDDLITHRLSELASDLSFVRRYKVNVVRCRTAQETCPVVTLANPNLGNLVGKIDREFAPNQMAVQSDHLMIRSGALLEADGGFLILDVRDVLREPGAWDVLVRTLKTGLLEIANSDPLGIWTGPQIKPEAIPVDIKVILVGDPEIYALLDYSEPRFASNFKVLVDFTDTVARDDEGIKAYINVIARIIEEDELLQFSAAAVAAVIEHGARICAQRGRLTSRFGRIADIVRESAFLASKSGSALVEADDVISSIQRSKRRAALPVFRFNRLIADGTLLINVKDSVVGQINALAVTSAGPLVYGFPTRLTASIGPGGAGAVNIERESDLSGSAHTKGFLILSGLLRYLLDLPHPMAFSSSIAFEQTYGGVDGDSASGAEFCCLISALTGLPIHQGVAMTGAIDQKGNILPIGAASEKIEGFFDACKALEFTGSQGVIIPAANSGELMLRHDVVEAIDQGTFNVYAISRIEQALGILMATEPGDHATKSYKKGTVLAFAQSRAHEYWETAKNARSDK